MSRILLAVGHESFEKYLKDLVKNHNFIGEISYREGVVSNCLSMKPDILILRETLPGSTNILDLVYELRQKCFATRIIFISKERKIGDSLLSELVSLGVFDILSTNPIKTTDLLAVIDKPKTFSDVSFYRQKMTIDESSNEISFTAPKEIIKTVYVEKDSEKDDEYIVNDLVDLSSEEIKNISDEAISNEDAKKTGSKRESKSKFPIKNKKGNNNTKEVVDGPNNADDENYKVSEIRKTDILSNPIRGNNKNKLNISSGKTKIVTFLASNHGVGSSQVAFNTAVELSKNFKTLYVESSDNFFSLYNIFYLSNIRDVDIYRGNNLDNSIINKKKLIKNVIEKCDISKNYRFIPDKLSMLFLPLNEEIDGEMLKDLLIELALQYSYDFIIFDFGSYYNLDSVKFFISNSSQIYIVTTQDFNYISSANAIYDSIECNRGFPSIKLIINKYDAGIAVNRAKIEEFIERKVDIQIPYTKDILNNNYLGIPTIVKTKDKLFINSINEMINIIIKS